MLLLPQLIESLATSTDQAISSQAPTDTAWKALPLPANGAHWPYRSDDAIAPLAIETIGETDHFYVKVVHWYTKAPVATVFIRAGRSAEISLPLGSFEIRYATGSTWYGTEYLFGEDTAYSIADSRFDFKREGDRITGYTIQLYLQRDGNLGTKPIKATDF